MRSMLAIGLLALLLVLAVRSNCREDPVSGALPADAVEQNRRANERQLRQLDLAKRLGATRPSTLPSIP